MSRVVSPLTQENFAAFWQKMASRAAVNRDYEIERVNITTPIAEYALLRFTAADGTPLRARYIRPARNGLVPTVLQFHDFGCGVHGWHYLTRYIALGYAVVALENRTMAFDITGGFDGPPEELVAARLLTDALSCAYVALELPGSDPGRLFVLGNGFGGGQAIAAAAQVACAKCALLNPQPLNFRGAWEAGCDGGVYQGIRPYFRTCDAVHRTEKTLFTALDYVDCIHFAPMVTCNLLLGTSLMNTVSPIGTQEDFFGAVCCPKRQVHYPKYEHERINSFEDEVMKFLLEV